MIYFSTTMGILKCQSLISIVIDCILLQRYIAIISTNKNVYNLVFLFWYLISLDHFECWKFHTTNFIARCALQVWTTCSHLWHCQKLLQKKIIYQSRWKSPISVSIPENINSIQDSSLSGCQSGLERLAETLRISYKGAHSIILSI